MKPHQVLLKYFEVYGQVDLITPEAEKKGSFFTWWTIFGPNEGLGGESMNPMTFGNMKHPSIHSGLQRSKGGPFRLVSSSNFQGLNQAKQFNFSEN